MAPSSTSDLRYLPAFQFQRGGDHKLIAKRIGTTADRVTRKIRALEARRLIEPGIVINNFALGFRDQCVLFSPMPESERATRALVRYVASHPAVAWFAELAGEHRFAASVLTKGIHDFAKFFDDIHSKFGPILSLRMVAERTSLQIFPCRWYGDNVLYEAPVVTHTSHTARPVDSSDETILRTLSESPASTTRELMRKTGLPQTTVSYRIRRLRDDGVLTHLTWVHDANDFGYISHRIILISRSPSASLRHAVERFCRNERAVYFLATCVGAWDFEIACVAKTSAELRAVLQKLWEEFGSLIVKIHVLEHLSTHRTQWFCSPHLRPKGTER